MTGIHPYLEEALILRDRLDETCLKLEENLRQIEGIKKPSLGIHVKDKRGMIKHTLMVANVQGDKTHNPSSSKKKTSRCSGGKRSERVPPPRAPPAPAAVPSN